MVVHLLELGRSHFIVVFLASLMPAPSSGPETIVRWHRMGFAAYWRWKSRPLGGRSQIDKEVRDLIRRMIFEKRFGVRPTSTVSCSSSALMLPSRRSTVHRRILSATMTGHSVVHSYTAFDRCAFGIGP